MFSSAKKQGLLGIDISSSAVKLIELKRKKNKQYQIESYAVVPLPEGASDEDSIALAEPVADCIKKAVKDSRTKLKSCCLAVPASGVINKIITIPEDLPENEQEIHVRLEAEQYIPYPIEEVHIDFEVQGPAPHAHGMLEVKLVATRQENVDIRVSAAEMAGLKVDIVDIESYALERVINTMTSEFDHLSELADSAERKVVAVVDFGAVMCNMVVFENGEMIFSQEHAFGGKQLTSEIMQRYGLNWQQAGAAKKQGDLPESYIPEVLEPFKERLTQQVERFLQLYYAASSHGQLDKILLAGGTALIPGMDEQIQQIANVPTSLANPFADCVLAKKVNPARFNNDIPAMLIAAGLSIRGVNHG